MEKSKVIFLDRDGTINYDYGYVHKKEQLKFLPGVIESLKQLYDAGYKLIIVTNQSGIARGYFSLEEYYEFNQYMLDKLKENSIEITDVYFCPHKDEDNCECRKPKLKLFYDAIEKYNIDLDNSYAIGDKERDLSICRETNITGMLIYNKSDNYLSFKNFEEATKYIINKS